MAIKTTNKISKGVNQMPKKLIPNQITLREVEDVLTFLTFSKKNHFDSEAKLYDSLSSSLRQVNPNYTIHLTTYPYIAVHISFGLKNGLSKDKETIKKITEDVLKNHLKQT